MTALPRPGELLTITVTASVQFVHPILFRVISASEGRTCDGWAWLEGYEIDATSGNAIDRRAIFVQLDGLGRIPRQGTANDRPTREPQMDQARTQMLLRRAAAK